MHYADQLQPVNITHVIYQLLFIWSWSSWWWAASLLETCRGFYWNKLIENSASCWFVLYGCVRLFVVLEMFVLLHYSEHCFVVDGCTYNQQNLELSFLWAQSLLVHLPVWRLFSTQEDVLTETEPTKKTIQDSVDCIYSHQPQKKMFWVM
jgi:hypothetical protein